MTFVAFCLDNLVLAIYRRKIWMLKVVYYLRLLGMESWKHILIYWLW